MSESPETTDVVVVGTGAAGLSTALTAADAGANVLVLEKGAAIGGTTAKSHGFIWICDNEYQRSEGIVDAKDDVLRYLARTSRPARFDPADPHLGVDPDEFALFEAFYDHGTEAFAFMQKVGGLKVQHAVGFPDYHASALPEGVAKSSRTYAPVLADGSPGNGASVISQLADSCVALGVRIEVNQRVNDVTVDDSGRVTGVSVTTPQGERIVHARNGVVFASGGFTHDPARRRNFLSGPALGGCAALTNEGDFHTIAEAQGVPMKNMNYAWYCPIPLEAFLADDPDPGLSAIFTPQGDSMLYVNKYGRRTINEKGPYHEVARSMFRWDQRRREYPDLFQFPIWDQRTLDIYAGLGVEQFIPALDDPRSSEMVSAPTLEGIAAGLSERLEKLRPKIGHHELAADFAEQASRSIQRFNEFAVRGVDEDWGRGEAPIDHAFHDFAKGPDTPEEALLAKNTMYPLSTEGPFYATILAAGTLDTKGGPWTNGLGQVIGADGNVVPGLHGVGNCVASPSGEAYWGAGGTLGPIITFGWLTGRQLTKD